MEGRSDMKREWQRPYIAEKTSPEPRGRAKVMNRKSIFHSPSTPNLPTGIHHLSVYPAVGHITVDLVGTDRVRRHPHLRH